MADDNNFDPAWSLGQDDPLRAWMSQVQGDPGLHALMATDPQRAAEVMAQRGIMPPPTANAYTDPASGLNVPSDSDNTYNAPIRTNPDGTLAGNITSPSEPAPMPEGGTQTDKRPIFQRIHDYFNPIPSAAASPGQSPASVTPPNPNANSIGAQPMQKANSQGSYVEGSGAGTDLDPSTDEPLNGAQPSAGGKTEKKAGNENDDATAKSPAQKAVGGFADSLKGVKAPPLPPLNAVGTPGAPHPGSVSPPNLVNLLTLVGQNAPNPALATLGRLLVQGKA